ncbi:MAG: AraC family transcriptional regulator [Ketobacteraceae bacterium]|nr:AraC family transcriptional regulator [Ketobacteraceae bacterium]
MTVSFANNKAIAMSYVLVMADLIDRRGGNSEALLRKAGIRKQYGKDPLAFITLAQYEALLRGVVESVSDPAVGLYLGKDIQFSDHGTFAYSALSFPTVWDALKLGLKFSRLANQVVDIRLDERQEFNAVRFDTAYLSGSLYPVVIEMVMSLFCEILKFMVKDDISSIELDFSYAPPEYVECYEEVFGAKVRFECGVNEVRIPKKLAEKPQLMANPAIAEKVEAECDALIKKIYEPKTVAQQIHEILFFSRRNFPQLEEMADKINMSPRTMRRRLQESETSYKKILENVRLELANRYLSTTRRSIGEIAELLGYADQNSFSYAYKKLTGLSPSHYRKQL